MTRKDYFIIIAVFIILHFAVYYFSTLLLGENEFVKAIILINTILMLNEVRAKEKPKESLWGYLSHSTWNKCIYAFALLVFFLWQVLVPKDYLDQIHPALYWGWVLFGFPLAYIILFIFVKRPERKLTLPSPLDYRR